MTTKLFEAYKTGAYDPEILYYIETYKPITIPAYIQSDCECWPRHEEEIVKSQYSTYIDISRSVVEKDFDGDYVIYTIHPKEIIQLLIKNKHFDYKTKLLPAYQVRVHYKNIKAFH